MAGLISTAEARGGLQVHQELLYCASISFNNHRLANNVLLSPVKWCPAATGFVSTAEPWMKSPTALLVVSLGQQRSSTMLQKAAYLPFIVLLFSTISLGGLSFRLLLLFFILVRFIV